MRVYVIWLGIFLCFPLSMVTADEGDAHNQLLAIVEHLKAQLPPQPLSEVETTRIIADATDWIVASQEDDGHFRYEYMPFEHRYIEDDEIVRQAGTLYALAESYRHQEKRDPSVAAAIERSIKYLHERSQIGEDGYEEFLCVKNSRSSLQCQLGASSLALLGILSYVSAEPDTLLQYEPIINGYRDYIVQAKFSGRGFSRSYTHRKGFSNQESPFFNGEAMLALVHVYQHEPDETIRDILDDAFIYEAHKEELETPLYLWIMAALKDMHRLWPNDAYVDYAERFTTKRLDDLQYRTNTTLNYCASTEGLVSAYSVLKGDTDNAFTTRLKSVIEFWLSKNARLQLAKERPYRIVPSGDGTLTVQKMVDTGQSHGGFLTAFGVPTQRIDFTQHCLSAYLQKQEDIDNVL